jgi:hypothetical protein
MSLCYVQKQIKFDDWWSDEAEKRTANKITA